MQGSIAQSIGLVLAANAKRRGLKAAGWPDASIYVFCESVRFIRLRPKGLLSAFQKPAYDDPDEWLATVEAGARLRVVSRNEPNIDDRSSVGFANGGPVFLIEPTGSPTAWWDEWHVRNQSAEDRRIWAVTYHEGVSPSVGRDAAITASESKARLARALEDAIAFASAQKMGFDDYLTKATRVLDAPEPLSEFYHSDIIPAGLMELEYAQLFGCAAASWVFGGMGSWNDVWIEGPAQKDYERVSEQLFSAIISGLVTATNSTL